MWYTRKKKDPGIDREIGRERHTKKGLQTGRNIFEMAQQNN